jgi:4-diphosphocytidyl-2-C-methyl-D-erythritol kinase
VIVFPNCKINLGLNIIRKRSDGFHDIETIFYPLAIHDALEIIQTALEENIQSSIFNIQFSTSGLIVDGKAEDNLCPRAWQLLKKDFPELPSVKMHLHKTIPYGAGLGGGSADAAFTLTLLNRNFNLQLSTEKLLGYALQLGSDCPFFIINKPCFATGRGESLEPIALNLSAYTFVIVNPGIHVNTAEAFSLVTPALPSISVKQIIQQPVETWRGELKNDFEEAIFSKYPEIKNIKEELYKAGAVYASMSGSGSTVYGIFEKDKESRLSFPAAYFVKRLRSSR